MSAVSDFTRDIQNAIAKLRIAPGVAARKLSLEVLRGVVMKTPVDRGFLRAAWNVSVNELTYITEPGQQGNQSVPESLPEFPIIELTNGLPYAATVEFGDYPGVGPKTTPGSNPDTGGGIFSKQAPAGMMMLTLEEMAVNYRSEL